MESQTPPVNHQLTLDLGSQPGVVPAPVTTTVDEIPGLRYVAEFISPADENDLLARVDAGEWRNEMARRVQHYGWRYDHRAQKVDRDSYLGPLPSWLKAVALRLANHLDTPADPDQVIVNEYQPGQGIAQHKDCVPCFGNVIATVSLASDIQMDFHGPRSQEVPMLLQRRSLIALAGPSQRTWTHGIKERNADPRFGITRSRRVSLTFRKVYVRR